MDTKDFSGNNAYGGNKRAPCERNICSKFITPAIQQAGWDLRSQIREELTFSTGSVIVRGRMHNLSSVKYTQAILVEALVEQVIA